METTLLVEIVQFVVAVSALIIVHELGHFVAARLLKIEVEEFGIGIPPRLLTLFEIKGTKFSLNWLPLGGFVRPKGETDPDMPGGLAAASAWVRFAVAVAGPIANLAVGVLLYAIIFSRIGTPIPDQVQVIEVAPNSPAALAGLQSGDMILNVNDQTIDSMTTLQNEINANLDKAITLAYQREGQDNQVSLVPRSNPPAGEGAIGIVMTNPTRPISIVSALPMSAVAVYHHGLDLLSLPVHLLTGKIPPGEGRLIGFKGMFDIYQEARESAPAANIPADVNVLGFFTTVTISLGILNLLPIPALDGGRILFTLPEIVLRRRIPPQYENTINLVSFLLLIALLIYINLQDFINPIQFTR